MTVTVILGLVLSFVVGLVGPLLRAHYQSAAKLGNIQSAASAMYQLQRDLRQTAASDVFACTTGTTPSCGPAPLSFDTTTNAIVFPTSYSTGRGQFALTPNTSTPNWTGVAVYWVDSKGGLHWAFDANPGPGFTPGSPGISPSAAAQAVTDATGSNGTVIANNVQKLFVAHPAAGTVSAEIQAQSTVNGFVNETTYQIKILTRNGS